jgi:YHS domain-containing protein
MNKLIASTFLCISLTSACGGNKPAANTAMNHGDKAAPVNPADLKAPGDAAVGDRTTCPISGETFVVTANSPKVEFEGKTYFMCCPGCEEKFKADPQKYLTKA